MQLVATKSNGDFFRGQTINATEEQDKARIAMVADAGEILNFQTMTDDEFDMWLDAQ
ncbi:MAG: hypothetical protein WCY33_06415 [Clostridia bacterium]